MNLMVTDKPQPNKMPTICLNMIVKNEANIIVKTFNNLAQHINFDYWVISDTGSTDGTQQIIRDYFLEKGIPGELFQHEWRDFGYNRTKALECAYDKTDFLLVFDADDNLNGDFKLPFVRGKPLTAYADRYMLKIGKGFEYVRPLLMNNHKRWSFRGVLHEFLQNLEPVNEEVTLGGDYYIESGRTGNRSQNPTKYYDDAIILENAYHVELALPDKGLSGRYAFYCARSYKDAGEKYYEKALEWYKLLLGLPNHWNQEKYYAALEVGAIYLQQKKMDQAVIYLLKTLEYDGERIEGLVAAIEYFYQTDQHVLINALYHKYKNYNKNLMGKLFINMNYYQDRLEFFNAISAYYVNDKATGYLCCKHVLKNQLVGENEILVTAANFMTFYKDFLEKDLDTLSFFHSVDTLLSKNNALAKNKHIIELWNLLFTKNRPKLTALNKEVVKKIQRKQLHCKSQYEAGAKDKILITFTTCKRLDLFKETLHSILNHWTDVDLITDWFCVDDNSSKADRHYMKSNYTWIEYYMKTLEEKGHRPSMNIIWQKLEKLKPTYWIHMEDDFIFHHPMDYVKQARDFLQNANANANSIKQIVFNRNYAETIEDYKVGGHLPLPNYTDIVVHDHRSDGASATYPNSHYWPHYSFRPSMVLVAALMPLGNFDSANQFFERDYADKWNAMNYKTAFFNRITHRHSGRLTSEISNDKVKNAYQLNDEAQFQNTTAQPITHQIKVINLERRNDRKNAVIKELLDHGITEYSFFKAVDGKNLLPTNEMKHLFRGNDFGNRKGVIGCALSHLKLWQDLVADKQQTYYVIFEDDITLSSNNFKERFNQLKPECEKHDLLLLGYHMFTSERAKPEIIARYDTINDDTQLQIKPNDTKINIGGTFAYAINKVGAQKLLNYIEANGIKHGIDYIMIKKVAELNVMEIQPLLVVSPWYENRANPVDSDIQDLRDCFNFTTTIEDQFEFIVGLDQIGNDIQHRTGTLPGCMAAALNDVNCAGFNTLGFFKNKIDISKLVPSVYFKATDGIYIKKSYVKEYALKETTIRLKMLCNWCSSEQLCKEWQHMADGIKNVELTWSNSADDIDYYVIINYPQHGSNDYYDPARTIVFQMEPWVADESKRWGVKTWGKWAQPDPTTFFKVFTHKTHLNNVQWQINYPFASKPMTLGGDLKQNRVATICSAKNFDEGHLLRNKFLHFLTDADSATTDSATTDSADSMIDIWGQENYHEFKTGYKGPVPADDKYNVYANYKYCLAVENNQEHNYATEKLWEAILCESLCFYWGCPNLEEYIDPQAFVRLPLEDPAAALKIIQQALAEDWWTQRLAVIKQMKEKILTQLGFFPLMAALCSKKI